MLLKGLTPFKVVYIRMCIKQFVLGISKISANKLNLVVIICIYWVHAEVRPIV